MKQPVTEKEKSTSLPVHMCICSKLLLLLLGNLKQKRNFGFCLDIAGKECLIFKQKANSRNALVLANARAEKKPPGNLKVASANAEQIGTENEITW